MRNRNRSSIDIACNILETANGGSSKMQIMYRVLLSYKQMKEYVNFLTEKGLLVYDCREGQAQMFKTSERGLRFLETYNRLNEMIKEGEQIRPSLQSQVWMRRKKRR